MEDKELVSLALSQYMDANKVNTAQLCVQLGIPSSSMSRLTRGLQFLGRETGPRFTALLKMPEDSLTLDPKHHNKMRFTPVGRDFLHSLTSKLPVVKRGVKKGARRGPYKKAATRASKPKENIQLQVIIDLVALCKDHEIKQRIIRISDHLESSNLSIGSVLRSIGE